MKRTTTRRAILSAGVFSRAAVLVALLVLSAILSGPTGYEPRARATASPAIFSPPVVVNDNKANDQVVPVIVTIPDGRLLVVWQDSRTSLDDPDVYVSTSLDNGTSFAKSKRADDSSGPSQQIEPAVAVSSNGSVLLAWQDNRGLMIDYDIYFAESYDGGATFTKNVRVDDSSGAISWQEHPSIAAAAGGVIYIAWTDDRTGILRVRGAFSTDGGVTFSRSEEVVPGGTSGQTGVVLGAKDNRIFAAFIDNCSGTPHPYLCISTNGGKSFSAPVRLDNTGTPGAAQRGVSLATMPGGGVVSAWEDSRNGNWDIYACIVSSHGTISTSDVRVDDDSTGFRQTGVSVAADQLGNIYAAWADERDSLYAIRFSYLEAGAAGFNASIGVALPGGNDMQRRPSIVTTQPGQVFVAWQDDKAGTYDVYSSRAYFPGLFGLSLVDGWNFISIPSVGHEYWASTLGLKSGDIVSEWNSTTQTFTKNYIVGSSPSFRDFEISPSTGYWIYTGAHERINLKGSVPTSKQYKHIVVPPGGGWAVIGFESLNTSRHASDIPEMINVTGGISIVSSYDPIAGRLTTYFAGKPFMDFALVPGQGYWCWCTGSGTFSYAP